MIVSKIMSKDVKTCHSQDSLQRAAQIMWDADVGCVPVLNDENRVVGMVTDRDACMAAYTQGRLLDSLPVISSMAHKVFSCLPTDSIEQAESIMKKHQVRRLPVVDGEGGLVGLISMNDIARECERELGSRKPEVTADSVVSVLASVCQPRQGAARPLAAE